MNEIMKLLHLSIEFGKIGLFSVGGGLATLPFLYHMGQRTHWFTANDVSDMIAISQSTPGPMGINMATSVGFTIAGLWGAVVAPVALIIPSIIITIMISNALRKFQDSVLVQDIFYGLRPASIALIVTAGISVAKGSLLDIEKYNLSKNIVNLFDYKSIILAIIIAILTKFKFNPILLIVLSAIAGIIFKFQ